VSWLLLLLLLLLLLRCRPHHCGVAHQLLRSSAAEAHQRVRTAPACLRDPLQLGELTMLTVCCTIQCMMCQPLQNLCTSQPWTSCWAHRACTVGFTGSCAATLASVVLYAAGGLLPRQRKLPSQLLPGSARASSKKETKSSSSSSSRMRSTKSRTANALRARAA
jgi:hypothetical protein